MIKKGVSKIELVRLLKKNTRFEGMVVKRKDWFELQQDKKRWGKVIKGIDVGRLSDEEYEELCGEFIEERLLL